MARPPLKQIVLGVALALALARGGLAPGLMVAGDPASGFVLVLCQAHAGDEAIYMTKDGDFVRASELPKASKDGSCPFATALASVAAPAPFRLSLPVAFTERATLVLETTAAIGLGLAAPPPPLNGPPAARSSA